MIKTKSFDWNFLKTGKTSCKNIDMYYIGCMTIKNIGGYENIYSLNPLYFITGEVDGYIKEKNGNKYLVFASTDKNKELLTKYTDIWNRIKKLFKK